MGDGTLVAIHRFQFVLFSIVAEYLNGLIEENIESPLHSFWFVISALVQLTSIQVTYTGHFWWMEVYVIHMLMRSADQPSCKSSE